MTTPLPSVDTLKTQARRLRAELAKSGTTIGHSAALELTARQQGFKDWNTLHAAAGNRPAPAPFSLGQRISGRYLDQPFTGEVTGVQALSTPDMFRVTLHFDQPVDVVTFEGLSNFRQRVSTVISRDGISPEKTSNGKPHLVLRL
ncbi:MAG: glyoxalase superfamily protein [Pseudomonadota bacterium]